MTIEDLRLPCEHGLTEFHEYHDPSHPDCDVTFVTGHGHHWLDCPGGRVPTRQELIDILGGRPVVVMGGLSPAFYPADEDDDTDVFVVALGDEA